MHCWTFFRSAHRCHKYNIWPQLRASAAWVWISHQIIVSRIWEFQLLLSASFSLHQIRQFLEVPNPLTRIRSSTFNGPQVFEPSNLQTLKGNQPLSLQPSTFEGNPHPSIQSGTQFKRVLISISDNTSHSPLMQLIPIQQNHLPINVFNRICV